MSNIVNDISSGHELLGEIVAWQLGGVKVGFHKLTSAIRNAGLDETIVRTKLPKNAFTQAASRLDDNRVIDRLDETDTDIRFQFTRKYKNGNGEIDFAKEAILTMSKFTGRIFCEDNSELAEQAEELVSEFLDTYTSANISKYLRDLFRQEKKGIFSFPDEGGVYLVPQMHKDFVEKIESCVNELGGKLKRLPIAKGTEYGDRAFREAISSQIQGKADKHLEAVDKLTPDNQDRTFESRAREIQETRYEIEIYAAYLGSEAAKLLKVVEDAKVKLREKILQASAVANSN